MSSPSSPTRRRQRSARVVVASVLLLLAALGVAAAAVAGSPGMQLPAGVVAVVLGVAATRITHTELADSRREAAQDRARQAQAYRDLAADRVAEQQVYARRTTATIAGLVEELAGARTEVAEARRAVEREHERAERAEAEGRLLTGLLDRAEERAAEAVVRLAELEVEQLALTAELESARATRAPALPLRQHA